MGLYKKGREPRREPPMHPNWEPWEVSRHGGSDRRRTPVIRPVQYTFNATLEGGEVVDVHGRGLTINISEGGLCLLMDHTPHVQDVLRVQVSLPDLMTEVPTLGEVRWVRRLPLGSQDLCAVGVQFIL